MIWEFGLVALVVAFMVSLGVAVTRSRGDTPYTQTLCQRAGRVWINDTCAGAKP